LFRTALRAQRVGWGHLQAISRLWTVGADAALGLAALYEHLASTRRRSRLGSFRELACQFLARTAGAVTAAASRRGRSPVRGHAATAPVATAGERHARQRQERAEHVMLINLERNDLGHCVALARSG
jgi:hypothetical protein